MNDAGERSDSVLPQLKLLWQRRRDLDRTPDQSEGLRERKKRRTRQQISDMATGMFLELGFDDVRVADIAEACGVSEKTVYNYFPTKESLLFDREPDMIAAVRRALGPGAPPGSPVTAFADELVQEMEWMARVWSDFPDGDSAQSVLRRFHELVDQTPSLRAAYRDMSDRIAQVAAEELAARAGVDPMDPEPQIAATAICSLWQVMFRAIEKHVDDRATADEVCVAAVAELRRAARLIDTGLWSFGLEVQGTTSAQHIKRTAEAASEARKQVMVALKAAKAEQDEKRAAAGR